jgi:DNA sulfur modification protein DndB
VSWIYRINKARQTTHHTPKGLLSKDDVDYVRKVHRLVKTHIAGKKKIVPEKIYLGDEHQQQSVLEPAAE